MRALSAHEYARKLVSFSKGVDDITERHRLHREQIDALAVRIDRALKEAGHG